MKPWRIRAIGNDLSIHANDRIVLFKNPFHIEKIVVTDDEVIVDKCDHIRCIDQTRYSSVTLAGKAGAAKYSSHVGNWWTDRLEYPLESTAEMTISSGILGWEIRFTSTFCRISGRAMRGDHKT